DIVLIAVDESPQRHCARWELTGIDEGLLDWGMRFPLRTDQRAGESALDLRDPAKRFGVAVRDLIPDTPNILPALVADAVKEAVLQILRFVSGPPPADVDHVARLKPLESADGGDGRKVCHGCRHPAWSLGRRRVAPIAPGHVVPHEHLVGVETTFRF